MGTGDFERHLKSAGIDEQAASAAVRLADRYEGYLEEHRSLQEGEALEGFAAQLVASGEDTVDAIVTLARFEHFRGRFDGFEAALLMLDAEEVPRRLEASLPPDVARSAFGDLRAPSLGMDGKARAEYMRVVLDRLDTVADRGPVCAALRNGLHADPDNPPAKQFADARKRFLEATDLDAFIAAETERYLGELRKFMEEGRLYFTQPITRRVLDYVRETPTCACGVREGDRVRVTKIPYRADLYLTETDPVAKRRHYCHCPWARESLAAGKDPVSASLCECSAAWVGMFWEGVFGRPVQVDVVRTVLQGYDVCEFLVHIPAEALPEAAAQ